MTRRPFVASLGLAACLSAAVLALPHRASAAGPVPAATPDALVKVQYGPPPGWGPPPPRWGYEPPPPPRWGPPPPRWGYEPAPRRSDFRDPPRREHRRWWRRHVDWCLDEYRSYDPDNDIFLGRDGRWHRCRAPFD